MTRKLAALALPFAAVLALAGAAQAHAEHKPRPEHKAHVAQHVARPSPARAAHVPRAPRAGPDMGFGQLDADAAAAGLIAPGAQKGAAAGRAVDPLAPQKRRKQGSLS